ncbi:MAG: hypothetical protein AAFO98_04525, partial [Pseudomonadota bacterium]
WMISRIELSRRGCAASQHGVWREWIIVCAEHSIRRHPRFGGTPIPKAQSLTQSVANWVIGYLLCKIENDVLVDVVVL